MFSYRMEGEEYALVDEFDQIHWAGEEVAVGFSYDPDDDIPGTMHKHGSPESVNRWASTAQKALRAAGDVLGQEMADAITVVSGKIPLEELTKMIEISGYVGVWYRRELESAQVPGQKEVSA